jgi:hypothetical protein
MLKLVQGSARKPARKFTIRTAAPRTGDAVSDWTLAQFSSEGALGGHSANSAPRTALSLHATTARGTK